MAAEGYKCECKSKGRDPDTGNKYCKKYKCWTEEEIVKPIKQSVLKKQIKSDLQTLSQTILGKLQPETTISKSSSKPISTDLFSPKIFSEMKRLKKITLDTGTEMGFPLCQSKDGTIEPGTLCKGEECEILPGGKKIPGMAAVTLERSCDIGKKFVGTFHTHPWRTEASRQEDPPGPSGKDILLACKSDDIFCVASKPEGKRVSCYIKKKEKENQCIEYSQAYNDLFWDSQNKDLRRKLSRYLDEEYPEQALIEDFFEEEDVDLD